jgi:hypothetical protein
MEAHYNLTLAPYNKTETYSRKPSVEGPKPTYQNVSNLALILRQRWSCFICSEILSVGTKY